MTKYFVGISYHDSETYGMWEKGVIEDFESSTGIFILANSESDALSWAEEIGEKLFAKENPSETKDWKNFEHFCWIEKNLNKSGWSHCLDFFQIVKVGHFPDFKKMGSGAYERWNKIRKEKRLTYLKFDNLKNKTTAPKNRFKKIILEVFIKVISIIIPKANLDFEHLIDKVDFWKIEFNLRENITEREIGFDNKGVSIIAMPMGNNYGFWTDNNLTMEDYDLFKPTVIRSSEFDVDWKRFAMKFNK